MEEEAGTLLLHVEVENAYDSEQEDLEECLPSSKRPKTASSNSLKKWTGAAVYKTKFQRSWEKKWPFAVPVTDNPHSFRCTVCAKNVSCGHQGERDLVRHSESAQHKKNVRSLKSTQKLNFGPTSEALILKDKVSSCDSS